MTAAWLLDVTEQPEKEGLGQFIVHHLKDSHEWNLFGHHLQLPTFPPVHILGVTIDFSITLHVVMLWTAALILITLFGVQFRKRSLVPRGAAAILEMMALYVRDEISIPNLGTKRGRQFTPFLATMFFMILTANLMGLFPLFVTATGDISVTASLAIVTFFATQLYAIIENGFLGYLKQLAPPGIPPLLYIIIVPIEIVSLFTKPFALAMRLFANMIAGHAVIFALLGLIIALGSVFVSPFSVGLAVFIALLEILVAFIQAYIFTMLSALFIGMAMHPEH